MNTHKVVVLFPSPANNQRVKGIPVCPSHDHCFAFNPKQARERQSLVRDFPQSWHLPLGCFEPLITQGHLSSKFGLLLVLSQLATTPTVFPCMCQVQGGYLVCETTKSSKHLCHSCRSLRSGEGDRER